MSFLSSYKLRLAPMIAKCVQQAFFQDFLKDQLSEETFRQYILQDCIYLRAFSRILPIVAEKAPNVEQVAFLCEQSRTSLIAEQGLHVNFLEEWGISSEDIQKIEASIDCLTLLSYLKRIAIYRSYAESLAAITSTYWVYASVFTAVAQRTGDAPIRYQNWIEIFKSEAFLECFVPPVMALLEKEGNQQNSIMQERMINIGHKVAQLEYRLWDGAYRSRNWDTVGI